MSYRDETTNRARTLYLLADRQAGYFTAKQAKTLGYSHRLHHHHRQQGHWIGVGHGLFRLRDYPVTPEEDLVRLTLWSRGLNNDGQATVSHESALALYELSDLMPAKIHLCVPPSFRKTPPKGVVLHKATLVASDVEQRAGYHVTTPLRTLLDVAASPTSPEHLHAATREALERGLVRRANLNKALVQLQTQARERLEAALVSV